MVMANFKYIVFIAFIALIFILLLAFLSNINLFMQNMFWLAILAVFLLSVWKFDFILLLKDYERAVIMRFGKVNRVGGPGWTVVLPGIETPTVIDLRTQTIDVPKQDVITKGNIELKVDAVIYLKVKKDSQSVINSVVEIEDYKQAIRLYVISTIRDIVGNMELAEVTANMPVLQQKIKESAAKISAGWGIEVVSVDLKDVDIPPTVLDAMHAEKAAIQKKFARMESAKAHMAEINAVKQAAEGLSDKALAYYYIQALEKLGEGKSTKFFFPMELTKLAEAVGGSFAGKASPDVEKLFEKYAPAITGILSKGEKAAIKKKVVKKKKKK